MAHTSFDPFQQNWSAWGFGPWSKRSRFFENGEVRLAILSLLAEGPCHGYELMKRLEDRSGGTYKTSAGTVYPTLQQLEDEQLITSAREEGRRVYHITDEGRRVLAANAETVDNIWKRAAGAEDWSRWMGPEFSVVARPLGALIKVAVQAVRKSDGDRRRLDEIHSILERAHDDLERLR